MTRSASILPAVPTHLADAADRVRKGGVIVYPTETVYGLGADPFNPSALSRVFSVKRREADKALILLIRGPEDLRRLVARIPKNARTLMETFWPGPLTLVFRAAANLPETLLGPGATVALRLSDAPVARDLLDRVGGPITSTSANLSGRRAACSAEEAAAQLGDRVDLILDGGRLPDAGPSTVVRVTGRGADIVRPGRISSAAVRKAIVV